MPERTDYRPGEFSWVDLLAHDLSGAHDFYSQVFGWNAATMDTQGGPPYTQFELKGKGIGGAGEMPDEMKGQGIPPHWNTYVSVTSVEDVTKKAVELGGQVTMPPMQVYDAGWLAYIQDPTGAVLGLWQPLNHCGAQLFDETGTFCWSELITPDVEKAKAFYSALFGWEIEEQTMEMGPYSLIKVPGLEKHSGGMMKLTEEFGDMPPCWNVYFRIDNAQETAERATAAGGQALHGPFDTEVGPIAVLSDPQGAVFNVIQLKEAA